ncbi:unnamed protein product [Durusdinium trenchii]|uniref:Uncharacterized protein n=1 Tax=Durusdinium trenchii TaxID=1381693 RepID=A0ABP0SA41_9DINO
MYLAFLLCLAVVPNVAERFHRVKFRDVTENNAIDPPDLEELKKWTEYFQSSEGGGMYPKHASSKAFEVLQGNPPDLDEVKKWGAFFHDNDGMYWKDASAKALNMLTPKSTAEKSQSPEEPTSKAEKSESPAEPEAEGEKSKSPESTPPKMLDCDVPAIPKDGDPFGKACKEGSRSGFGRVLTRIRHGERCSPVCSLGHKPQPDTLVCENGVIGSFECPEYIDPLQKMCKDKCEAEGKGYQYKVSGGKPSCVCIDKSAVLNHLPF